MSHYLRRLPTSIAKDLHLSEIYTTHRDDVHSAVLLGHTTLLRHFHRRGESIPGAYYSWLYAPETAKWIARTMAGGNPSAFLYIGIYGDVDLLRFMLDRGLCSNRHDIEHILITSLELRHFNVSKLLLPLAACTRILLCAVMHYGTGELLELVPGIKEFPIHDEIIFAAISASNMSTLTKIVNLSCDVSMMGIWTLIVRRDPGISSEIALAWRDYMHP